MSTGNQVKITVNISTDSNLPYYRKPESFNIDLEGYAAAGFKKLLAAGKFGVHVSQIEPDTFARFEQSRVPYERFRSHRRDGGDTRVAEWVRLAVPMDVTARIIAEEAA